MLVTRQSLQIQIRLCDNATGSAITLKAPLAHHGADGRIGCKGSHSAPVGFLPFSVMSNIIDAHI